MIKAAIVFNLRHFVVWPDSDRVVHVGVLGEGPVAEALVRLDGRGGSEGHVVVRRIEHLDSGEPLDLCFVGEQVRPFERDALVQLSERGVLTVSDGPDFLERGGILQLVVRDRRVHLRVQLDRARRAHLQLRAQLLKLAEVVND